MSNNDNDLVSNMSSNDNDLVSNMSSNDNDLVSNNVDNNNTDTNTVKIDKRKRESYEPSEWKLIQEKRLTAFRKKQSEKKQKLNSYNDMKNKVELLEKILLEHGISLPSTDPIIVTEEFSVENEISATSVQHSVVHE